MGRYRHAVAPATLAILALIWPSEAAATPQDLFGYGARTPAMGMAGVSFVDDYEAVYVNPAGLGRARQRGIFAGLHGAAFNLSLDSERFPFDGARASSIGFQLPLPFGGVLHDRLVVGAAFFTPVDVVLRNEVLYTEIPQWPVLTRSQVVAVQVAMGVDLGGLVDGLYLGFGVSALADTGGRLDVRIDEVNRFVAQTETQLLAGFSPMVGVQYDLGDVSLGAVYRSELSSEINIDIEVDLGRLPVEVPLITISALAQYDPHTIAVGAAWRPAPGWLVTGDANVRLWAKWPGLQSKTTMSSNTPPRPSFNTTVSPRVALERSFTLPHGRFDVRGGYAFEPTPAPPARLAPGLDSMGEPRMEAGEPVLLPMRYLDNARHVLTAGVGARHTTPRGATITFDVYAQAHILAERGHEIPAPGGTDNMRTRGFILGGGWTAGVQF